MTEVNSAGYYHAAGDPPGTVRYWDGTAWTGEPRALPERSAPADPVDRSQFGGVGVRVGAVLLDYVFTIAIAVAAALLVDVVVGLIVVPLVYWIVTIVLTARRGGSPGKLAVGLRVTETDGVTSPPGWGPAFVRTLPAAVGGVPIVGGLLILALSISNVVFVARDDERRSVHDRIGGTRVVYRNRL